MVKIMALFLTNDLFELSKVVQSNNAPTTKQWFKTIDDNWRFYNKRLGTAWSKKQCDEMVKRIAHSVKSRTDDESIKRALRSNDTETLLYVLIQLAVADMGYDKVNELVPSLFK